MMRFQTALILLIVPGTASADEQLVNSARKALEKSVTYLRSISTHGGYLWRYSLDLKIRAGEREATESQVWVQPPGTPSVGMAFLKAYEATDDPLYLEAARDAATALAIGQLESGGWDYLIDFDPKQSKRWYHRTDIGKLSPAEINRRRNISTYDDNTTQSALVFLMTFLDAVKDNPSPRDEEIETALNYGLMKLLEAQYPNGAWPQRYQSEKREPDDFPVIKATIPKDYPREHPGKSYLSYYTFNDHAQRDIILTLLKAWKHTGDERYRKAAQRGGDFIILAQLPEPQPIWAQQYNARMEPSWARAFEPPAACAGESSGVMRTLVDLYLELGDEKYLEPIPRALKWYQRSKIRADVWARFYELGTNKPIYGDRDGKIHYRLEDISEERQNHYGWQGSFGVPSTIRYYEQVKKLGRERWLEQHTPKPLTQTQKESRLRSRANRVRKVIAALDDQGRWITRGERKTGRATIGDRIETGRFIDNIEILADYLTLAKP